MEITSPIAGVNVGSQSSATYTLASDVNVDRNQRGYTVTACGGTTNNGLPHSASFPFRILFTAPKAVRVMTTAVAQALGVVTNVPKNNYSLSVEKGVTLNAVGGAGSAYFNAQLAIPIGSDVVDTDQLDAGFDAFIGVLRTDYASIRATILSGNA